MEHKELLLILNRCQTYSECRCWKLLAKRCNTVQYIEWWTTLCPLYFIHARSAHSPEGFHLLTFKLLLLIFRFWTNIHLKGLIIKFSCCREAMFPIVPISIFAYHFSRDIQHFFSLLFSTLLSLSLYFKKIFFYLFKNNGLAYA